MTESVISMNADQPETIYALSSGRVPSGVAIIRLSGPRVRFVLETMCGRLPCPRRATLLQLRSPKDGSILDDALVLWFPGPNSFTGDDVCEFHCHGGPAVVQAVLGSLGDLPGLRMAEEGEFTRRAFHNQKMDLVAVEGLSDLIKAETEQQRLQARHHAAGFASSVYESWRRSLIKARALIEAELDFPDEDDVPGSVAAHVWSDMEALAQSMEDALSASRRGERVRDGVSIVLAGAPNVGKSSLLNALARRDAAIVSAEAGTTRDVIDVHLDLDGVVARVSDTAGLRVGAGSVESIGIERAQARISEADLIVAMDAPNLLWDSLVEPKDVGGDREAAVITVFNKIDTVSPTDASSIRSRYDYVISVASGEGLSCFITGLSKRVADLTSSEEPFLATRARHSQAIRRAIGHLREAVLQSDLMELRVEKLRLASDEIGRITGRIDVDDLLDVIFREFCIGK